MYDLPIPTPRATIKAHPATPHRLRPYEWGGDGQVVQEGDKRRLCKRMVYNDWGLYSFAQTFEYKCLRFGKEL